MAQPLHVEPISALPLSPRSESFVHHTAHGASAVLRPVLVIFLAATIVLMATFWPLAVVTGLIAIACGIGLVLSREVEAHSEAGMVARASTGSAVSAELQTAGLAASDADDAEDVPLVPGGGIDERVVAHESRTIAGIVGGLVLLATLMGLVLFEWPMLALGVGILLLYMTILSFPAWAAWIEGDAEAEAKRVDAET